MNFPECAIMLTGDKIIIGFDSREDAEKAFDILEGIMDEPVEEKDKEIRHDHRRKR